MEDSDWVRKHVLSKDLAACHFYFQAMGEQSYWYKIRTCRSSHSAELRMIPTTRRRQGVPSTNTANYGQTERLSFDTALQQTFSSALKSTSLSLQSLQGNEIRNSTKIERQANLACKKANTWLHTAPCKTFVDVCNFSSPRTDVDMERLAPFQPNRAAVSPDIAMIQ